MPVFGHHETPGRPGQDSLRPFSEEVINAAPRPVRPKRQRPRPSQAVQPAGDLENFQEAAFNDIPGDDLGFFNEVNFPDISSFGVGWDPKKIRRKREAYEVPLYFKRESKRPRLNRSQRPRRPARQSNRRQGPLGFWDDPDFDADFFNGGSPTPQNFPSFETYSNNYNQQYYPQPRPEQARPKPPSRGYAAHNTQKITQQTRPKIVPKRVSKVNISRYFNISKFLFFRSVCWQIHCRQFLCKHRTTEQHPRLGKLWNTERWNILWQGWLPETLQVISAVHCRILWLINNLHFQQQQASETKQLLWR